MNSSMLAEILHAHAGTGFRNAHKAIPENLVVDC